MEIRPGLAVLAPSEASPSPAPPFPPLCCGVLWASRAAPCAQGTGVE